MRKAAVILLFVVAGFITTSAQPYCTATTFTIRDGLAANVISGICQTPNQLMWFSTWNGLCCYDGYRFQTFRDAAGSREVLTSNRLLMARANANGDIWCLTYDNRIYLFDCRQCRFVDVASMVERRFGIRFSVRNIYTLSNGHTWLAGRDAHGANFRIDDRRITHGEGMELFSTSNGKLKSKDIKKVIGDDFGREWVFTNKGVTLVGGRFVCPVVFEYLQQVGRTVYLASTDGKIAAYHPGKTTPTFVRMPAEVKRINCLLRLDSRRLLIGTDVGVVVYDVIKGGERIVSLQNPSQPSSVVTHIFTDRQRRIWAFSEGDGVTLIDSRTLRPQWMNTPIGNPLQQTQSQMPFVHQDKYGTVWLVPRGGTFCYFDEKSRALCPYVLRSSGYEYANLPSIDKFFIDHQRNMWFTSTHDLTLVNFKYHHFKLINVERNQEVRAVCNTRDGRIWAGTSTGMVCVFGSDGSLMGYLNKQGRVQSGETRLSNKIYSMFEDRQGRLWIGTKGDGLYVIPRAGAMSHYVNDPANRYSLSGNVIYSFDQDSRGRIWIGSYGDGLNMVREDGDGTLKFINPNNELKSYPENTFHKIRRITHTRDGVMLISTNSGLLTFSERFARAEAIKFYISQHIHGDTASLASSDVMQTQVMSNGRIFVATLGGALQELATTNLLRDNLKFKLIKLGQTQEGIIQSLSEDAAGHLWITRESSLDLFNPATGSVSQYGPNDLGEHIEFSEAQPARDISTGRMSLGVMGGMVTFVPGRLTKSDYKPQIVFTSVQYQGEGEPQPILNTDQLDVPSDKRNLTISFSALDYTNNYLIKYAYMIEGVDQKWNYTGNAHSASYNSLPAGHLRMLVRSTNSDGVWMDNTRVLNIYSHPTFWETIWAKMLYLLLAASLIWLAMYIYTLRSHARMEQEMMELKTRFFTEISHKLRTPLTLIGGPVTEVLGTEELSNIARQHLEMVQRNSRRMLELVNKMLDHSKARNYFVDDDNAPVFTNDVQPAGNGDAAPSDVHILVVEDNDDLRTFLVSILRDEYVVTAVENGKQGLEKAETEMPDFILTDVMMPVMDGLTMIHQIKQNKDICHIPIVVLSAKASLDDRLQGLSEGIDDYITKPFSATYLKHRVANIISQRRMLQQTYLEQIKPEDAASYQLKAPQIVDADKELMDQLMTFLEEHIADSDLRVDDLADAVCLSRTVFYGKLKSIVGMTPVDFLRHIRIQHSEEMVAKSKLTFAQIAYAVGFSDPKYFGKCFKKETGMTPSEYRDKS